MDRLKWLYSGIAIGIFLLVENVLANEILERMVHPPDEFMFCILIGVTFLLSIILKADYRTMILVFMIYVSGRSLGFILDIYVCHDCDLVYTLSSSIMGYFILVLPTMFAGYKTWQYLERRKREEI